MTPKSAVAAVLLVALAGTWWWVLSGPTFQPQPPVAVGTAPSPRAASAVAAPPRVALERLAQRSPVRQPVRRNPFGAPGPSASAAGGEAVAARETSAAAPPPAPARWPAVSLIGISSRATPDGVERVAILAGERGIIHARPGDEIAGVYRVDRVTADAVELWLVPEARSFTLQLR